MAFTNDELLSSIRNRCLLPSSSSLTYTDAQILAVAYDELLAWMLDLVLSARAENLVFTKDHTIVAGTVNYQLPYRAVRLRDVFKVDANGNKDSLVYIEPELLDDQSREGFRLEWNNIVLTPSPTVGGTLRVKYYMRPGMLVATSEAAVVTSVVGSVVNISSAPTAFPTGATNYDFIGAKPANPTLDFDQSATRSGTALTFSVAPPSTLAVGDYVALSGQAPVPQIAPELHPLLAQRTAATLMTAMGFHKDGQALMSAYGVMEGKAEKVHGFRVDGEPRKIRGGILGAGRLNKTKVY